MDTTEIYLTVALGAASVVAVAKAIGLSAKIGSGGRLWSAVLVLMAMAPYLVASRVFDDALWSNLVTGVLLGSAIVAGRGAMATTRETT